MENKEEWSLFVKALSGEIEDIYPKKYALSNLESILADSMSLTISVAGMVKIALLKSNMNSEDFVEAKKALEEYDKALDALHKSVGKFVASEAGEDNGDN